jgi:L-ascorbate metabolism protein UlaG (beta-lactamase superfamily)
MFILHLIRKFLSGKKKVPMITRYTSNTTLKTVMPDWKGTPLDQDGLFINVEFPTVIDYKAIIKFMLQRNPQRETKKQDTWRIPVLRDDAWLHSSRDMIVWFGHASFFIQLSGVRILIDPVFGKLPVGKRYSELPVDPDQLLHINYILVSHAHYDHCDKKSLQLLAKNNPQAQILCGLKLDNLLRKWTNNPIQTAGWYQPFQVKDDLKITFLPSRHWANRSMFDVNTTLWGGFMIQQGDKSIYYGGDSGYGSHFNDIGKLFPNIDVALIGAGAYAPTWFMSPHHQDPYHAVKAFHDLGAKTFIPFHYGTFDSADEPMGEPEQILTTLKAEREIRNQLKFLKLGEAFAL